jgi:hypothetical protein
MSCCAAHQSEPIVRLLFQQALNLKLGFGSAGKRGSQIQNWFPFWRSSLEHRFDQHERRAAQNSIDQKEIIEPVCVNSRNPPPLHSHFPALFVAKTAKGNCGIKLTWVTNHNVTHPSKYGSLIVKVVHNCSIEGTQ